MTEYKATILITGGSSGLGKATAQQLALSQPNRQIVITGRSPRGVADEINTLTGRSNVTFLNLDLTTKAGARDFAKRFLDAGFPPIETFYYNAALQFVDKLHINEGGIEETFAVNNLNQTLVLLLLKKRLTEDARIVIVGSAAHHPEYSFFKLKAIWTTTEEVARPTKADEGSAWDEGMRRYKHDLCLRSRRPSHSTRQKVDSISPRSRRHAHQFITTSWTVDPASVQLYNGYLVWEMVHA
jgi:NAD(P)-dependent dehydrogenase (short-subunit alcohol dehydrogenase family)